MIINYDNYVFNEYQTPLKDLNIEKYPEEIQEQFFDFINTVPYIKNLISKDRPRAKDLPRDEEGKIIVDLTNPPIIEDIDYFRPVAKHFEETNRVVDLRPNPNPNSEYGKWIREEVRRCYEGYVRPSDGAWITGDMYFFLNYCPIMKAKRVKEGSKKGVRVEGFPDFWEGHFLKFHYVQQARDNAKHGSELASRGVGKSFTMASIAAKRFLLGESYDAQKRVETFIASYRTDYLNDDGILNKFESYIDWCAENTEFPRKRLINSMHDMHWQSGYKQNGKEAKQGSQNEVIGVSVKDSEGKLRGKRGAFIGLEEFGSFPNLIGLYGTLRPSMEDGDVVFGMIYCQGTAGDKDSDFAAAQTIMYAPKAFNMYPVPNVYDKVGRGRQDFVFFFPAYMNRNGCYNKDGISDVTKALLEILINRYTVKYNSTDANLITKTISEHPIVPQEAILRSQGNFFPVIQINERVNELLQNPNELDEITVGDLVQQKDGTVKFVVTDKEPIREYPLPKDFHNLEGAIEFYHMPQLDKDGKVYRNRYIAGYDPIDDDAASATLSLNSIFVLDLWTDEIVCEWTGRLPYADDCYEKVRLIALFYNAMILAENNKKGYYSYFASRNCSETLLAEAPEYLKDRNLVQLNLYGNKSKGFSATLPLNNLANQLIRTWLTKPRTIITEKEDGQVEEIKICNLMKTRAIALLREMSLFNPDGNFDRIRALGACMLYRESFNIMYEGDLTKAQNYAANKKNLSKDSFFTRNYEWKLNKAVNLGKKVSHT